MFRRWAAVDAAIGRIAAQAAVAAILFAFPAAVQAASLGPRPDSGRRGHLARQLSISLVGSIKGSGHFNFVYVQTHYAYIASGTSFIIYDVANPWSPKQVSSTPVSGGFSSVWLVGRYAYLSSYNTDTMSVWDVIQPSKPVRLGIAPTASHPYDIFARGNDVWVADYTGRSVGVYDVSNPTSPRLVGSAFASAPDYVFVSGPFVYTANRFGPGTGGMSIFNTANPAKPVLVSTISTGAHLFSVYVHGSYAYGVSESSNLLYVINVAKPASPVVVSRTSTGNNSGPYDVWVQGNYAFLANSRSDQVAVYDVSNPARPALAGTASTLSGTAPQYLYVVGNYIYVADWAMGALQIFRIN